MLGDNKALYQQLQQEGASHRTRYYERAVLLLKRAVLLLIFRPFLVTTQNMIADVMTKATDKGTYMKMRGQIMNNHVGLREAMYQGVACMGWNAQQAVNRIAGHL